MTIRVLIASYLEPEYVEQIRQVDSRLDVIYEPSLVARPRYVADHKGEAFIRSAGEEERWRQYLGQAEVIFDFDQTHLDDLPELAGRARWLQTTSSGVARFIVEHGYDRRMPDTVFTNAAGIHAQPLAEFCFMVMTMFNKNVLSVLEDQKARRWERYAGLDLSNRTLVIVGLGKVGQEVARLAKQFRMNVIGVKQAIKNADLSALNVDALYGAGDLDHVLPMAEFLVLIAPHTAETEKMMGEKQFSLMPQGAVLINIGRGALVDEPALVAALQNGHLRGAGLDVFETEPLPGHSPFWHMPNVIVSPHSASTTNNENRLITDLFCQNLKRYLAGKPLINVV
ncbi:D-2-hydroxyacid dehydrogenase [Chromatocurvus halotolerans]|uniref:Phosphoglycerate dehydrogenase-like enzyme n=2 Tax=Chromatocurvus halotolerans TaxID=1132028 RepID=A0A4R2KVM3_9GAMM|nr:D-2-hydroxyacid dehydrogenase [Chromatocurvus halotolerans]TCO76992.1 phosphoglycerate dehydrogenase-like enzyme [Chromatocurvus halotolerans]